MRGERNRALFGYIIKSGKRRRRLNCDEVLIDAGIFERDTELGECSRWTISCIGVDSLRSGTNRYSLLLSVNSRLQGCYVVNYDIKLRALNRDGRVTRCEKCLTSQIIDLTERRLDRERSYTDALCRVRDRILYAAGFRCHDSGWRVAEIDDGEGHIYCLFIVRQNRLRGRAFNRHSVVSRRVKVDQICILRRIKADGPLEVGLIKDECRHWDGPCIRLRAVESNICDLVDYLAVLGHDRERRKNDINKLSSVSVWNWIGLGCGHEIRWLSTGSQEINSC